MPFSHFWLVVRATEKSSEPVVDAVVRDVSEAADADSLTSSSSTTTAATTPLHSTTASSDDSIETRISAAAHNFGATALFVSEKVKRIWKANFTPDEDDDDGENGPAMPNLAAEKEEEASPAIGPLPVEESLAIFIMEEARRLQEATTPKERMRNAFRKNELTGELSPELRVWMSQLRTTFLVGCCLGYFRGRKEARNEFAKRNFATKFTSPMGANRKRMDWLIIKTVQNAWKAALPLTSFVALTMAVAYSVETWRHEEAPWHYGLGGALAGLNNRILLGPRAQLAGALIGGSLALICGTVIVTLRSTVGGITLKEYRYYRHVQQIMEEMYVKQMLPAPATHYDLYHKMPTIL